MNCCARSYKRVRVDECLDALDGAQRSAHVAPVDALVEGQHEQVGGIRARGHQRPEGLAHRVGRVRQRGVGVRAQGLLDEARHRHLGQREHAGHLDASRRRPRPTPSSPSSAWPSTTPSVGHRQRCAPSAPSSTCISASGSSAVKVVVYEPSVPDHRDRRRQRQLDLVHAIDGGHLGGHLIGRATGHVELGVVPLDLHELLVEQHLDGVDHAPRDHDQHRREHHADDRRRRCDGAPGPGHGWPRASAPAGRAAAG